MRGLWPTAWRTGIVTLGIYGTLNLGTLICSAFLGLKAAASYGLSMQLVLAAVAIAASFVAVKLPIIAQMHALGKTREIGSLVFPRMRWFWVVYIGLALFTIVFGERVINGWFHSKTPLLSTPLLIGLFIVTGLEGHHGVFRELAVTAHRNPFAVPVVVSGILIVRSSLLLVPRIGLWGLILVSGMIQLLFQQLVDGANWVAFHAKLDERIPLTWGLLGRRATSSP